MTKAAIQKAKTKLSQGGGANPDDLLDKVKSFLSDRVSAPPPAGILVAVSGGVDSMVLLHLLKTLAGGKPGCLAVAHFNHQLRGKESDADERLVRATARQWKIPAAVARANVRAEARRRGWSVEMAARKLRHEFFARAARRQRCRIVALAHHRDDQVELFFLRLLRGAGSEGLAGMKPLSVSPADKTIFLARPLLECAKSELRAYAAAHNIPFSEDATNASPDILRNRVRHQLLPLLRAEFQAGLDQTVLRTMDLLGAEAEAVRSAAMEWLAKGDNAFASLPVALQRKALRQQLLDAGIIADFALVERLRANSETPMSIDPGKLAIRDDSGRIRIERRQSRAFSAASKTITFKRSSGSARFGGLSLTWELAGQEGADFSIALNAEQFDADEVRSRIVLRHWRPGDRFQPIGAKSGWKLQDLFTNARVPMAERRARVVAVASSGEIFWVEGLRMAEKFKLRGQTRRRLLWRWKRKSL